jgi:uncharacterized SAM-binding protein YcdF (DUF218 family)
MTEAELAGVFFAQQGLDMRRVQLEGGARNTRENAIKVAQMLGLWPRTCSPTRSAGSRP